VWPYRVGVRYYKGDRPGKSDPEGAGRTAEEGGLQEREQRNWGGQAGQAGQESNRGRARGERDQYSEVGSWQVQNKSQNLKAMLTEILESCP
jgi:hypothetical protein